MEAMFGPAGLLSKVLESYEYREGQVQLTTDMADALITEEAFVGEAGTGIGKSLSYLLAVMAAGKRAIVATFTKALQDQLMQKDIPLLQALYPMVTAAVLKGRRNYLCLHEYDEALRLFNEGEQLSIFTAANDGDHFATLRRWLYTDEGKAAEGDLDQLPFGLPESVKQLITIDGQSCLGRNCPRFRDCYSMLAKKKAEAADLVIVNHRLLLLDLALNGSIGAEGGVLPARDIVILDESQHLEEVATESFGEELHGGQWLYLERRVLRLSTELVSRIRLEQNRAEQMNETYIGPKPEVADDAYQLVIAVRQEAEAWFAGLLTQLGDDKAKELKYLLTPDLTAAGEALITRTDSLVESLWDVGKRVGSMSEERSHEGERWIKLAERATRLESSLDGSLTIKPDEEPPRVRYVQKEVARNGERAVLHIRPVRVDALLRQKLWNPHQVLSVSATLTTGAEGGPDDPFGYWKGRVGLDEALTAIIPSPFPFKERVRLYVPKPGILFDPSRHDYKTREGQEIYRDYVLKAITELLKARRGGAFCLFTSFSMVKYVRDRLPVDVPGPVFVQNDQPTAQLVKRFKDHGSAILLGTKTFWEGVDVPGTALSLVIIDRLPFQVPDDPLWEARRKDCGDSWFQDLALPGTLMGLKQAFGRLMRRMDDAGVVAILDGRLRTKGYGKWLIAGLPPARLIGEVMEVERFTQSLHLRSRGVRMGEWNAQRGEESDEEYTGY